MPWWQSAFSSSSFSKSFWDDTHWGGKHPLKASYIFPRRGGSRHSRQPPRKLLHLADDDVEFRGSPYRAKPTSAAQPSPQPLPLPELHVLLRKDPRVVPPHSGSAPPPSALQHDKERARERPPDAVKCVGDVNDANGFGRLGVQEARRSTEWLAGQEARRSIEYSEPRHVRRSSPPMNYVEKLADNSGFNGPVSAPSSAYSSPNRYVGDTITPQYVNPPAGVQVWSAPELPFSDITTEKTAFIVDNNPLQSPNISPGKAAKIPSGPTDPLPKGTSQANVRPLPLPPGPMPHKAAPVGNNKPVKSRWQKGKLLGRGTFGSVYAASNRETGALCAMKEVEILPDDTKSAECMKQLEQEIKVLSNLKHPNIVQYYGCEIAGDRFYIYLEYVHPGSLTRFIKDHCAAITECVVRNFTRHILCGLAYLHSKKTIHRDIKGANLLVDAFGVVKLADFGMAKHLAGHRANLSLKGSPYWMAPELLQSVMREEATADIALAADIWSLGCTIIEMLTGKPPWSEYEGAAAMFKVLKENPPIPDNLSEEGQDFLNLCFRRNPAERPSASMLLEHPFMKEPHQLDTIPSFSEIMLTENVHSKGENPSNKVDRVPLFYDTQSIKGKLVDKDPGQAFNQMGVSHLSPRSTLEALPGLSPPHSSH